MGNEKSGHYSLREIKKQKARYNLIFGERSNGKTYAVLKEILERYFKTGEQSAYIRRYSDEFNKRNTTMLFNGLEENGEIEKITNGRFNMVYYHARMWWLAFVDENGKISKDFKPFMYGYLLCEGVTDKGSSDSNITLVCFDEFITRERYLPDEFVLFANSLSTIIRNRDNLVIYMLGNTVNKYCPYFKEMGLRHVSEMKQGDIQLYQYNVDGADEKLKVAVEYTPNKAKILHKSDIYFAFDNPKLRMITHGDWEIDIYPHCPENYNYNDIIFIFFIIFEDVCLQCEVINNDSDSYIYIHVKTTPIQHPDEDLIYTPKINCKNNYRANILKPGSPLERRITNYFALNKIFYQDNEVGELVNNYLNICKN